MAHQKRWMILFLAVSFFLTTGCGSETNSNSTDQKEPAQNSSTKLIEPCELITKAEAGEIMGVAFKEGKYSEQKMVGQKLCLYEAADENAFAFFQISLSQNAFIPPKILASGQNAQIIFSTIKAAFPDREMINGMGDEAFIATPGIHILKGAYYMTIAAGNINQNRDKLKTAGMTTMANLDAALK